MSSNYAFTFLRIPKFGRSPSSSLEDHGSACETGDLMRRLAKIYRYYPSPLEEEDIFKDEFFLLGDASEGDCATDPGREIDEEYNAATKKRRSALAQPLLNDIHVRLRRLEAAAGPDRINPATLVAHSPSLRRIIEDLRWRVEMQQMNIDEITRERVQYGVEADADLSQVSLNSLPLPSREKRKYDNDVYDPDSNRRAVDVLDELKQHFSSCVSRDIDSGHSSEKQIHCGKSLRYIAGPPVWPSQTFSTPGMTRIVYSTPYVSSSDPAAMDQAIGIFDDYLAEYMIGEILQVN